MEITETKALSFKSVASLKHCSQISRVGRFVKSPSLLQTSENYIKVLKDLCLIKSITERSSNRVDLDLNDGLG